MKYNNKQIKNSLQRVAAFIVRNNRKPNTIQVGTDTLTINDYLKLPQIVEAKQRVLDYKRKHKTLANYVTICDFELQKKPYTILYGIKEDETNILEYFIQKFGKVSTVDEILTKINNHGYGHYYNGKFSNKQTVDRIKAKTGEKPNCTDSCQLVMKLCKDFLGYKVECLHVQCASGEGHVRLRLKHKKHTGNEWIYRDPASVLSTGNNNGIRGQWCYKNYKLLAVNPKWFMDELNK